MIALWSLAGLLSGLLFGALAASLRRFVIAIVALPVLLAPVGYLVWWRGALSWTCLHADAFRTPACTATSAFVETTVLGLPAAAVLAASHLVAGIALALVLLGVRRTIDWALPPLGSVRRRPPRVVAEPLPLEPVAEAERLS